MNEQIAGTTCISTENVKTGVQQPNESDRVKLFGSGFGGTINFISTAIGGGGMFGNIFGASQLGIIGFVVITALSSALTYLTAEFLIIAASTSHRLSCYELSDQFLGGKKGELLTKLFIIFGNWSFVVNVIQIFADFLSNMLGIWLHNNPSDSFLESREFAVLIGLIFIFPWVQSKSIKSLEKLSGAFVLLCTIILLIIIVNAFKASLLGDVASSIQLGPTDYQSFFGGLPSITWCWTVQFNILPIYNTLKDSNKHRAMSHVTYWSCVSLFCYYVMFGFAALIMWGKSINADFMTNLDYNNPNYVFYYGMDLSTTTQFIMCIVTLSSIPMFAFEARTNLHYIVCDIYYSIYDKYHKQDVEMETSTNASEYEDMQHFQIQGENTPLLFGPAIHTSHEECSTTSVSSNYQELKSLRSNRAHQLQEARKSTYQGNWITRMVESGCIITTAAIVALYVTNLNWCLSIVGATYGCYIAYFLPSAVYWKAMATKTDRLTVKERLFKYLAVVCVVYGVIVCILGLVMAFI